ncbi:GAF domain-containing protein [Rhodobacteraceae bacterium RKSG542]|uniref:GAF domain-containing protein n=1 Tax=Pseudovibrio flavus TaxID=2529854 RepID=UPI0012BD2D96|nr:GAF domain-containing protein [Pseudovibrio flavus]MTI18016.1 GAF domain-containing protein [Pseudovibrio flavus]
MSEFDSYVGAHFEGTPILLWEVNVLRQSFSCGFHTGWQGFPFDICEVLKNPSIRKNAVHPDDYLQLTQTLHDIQRGRSASVHFRLVACDNQPQWFKLCGAGKGLSASKSYGFLIRVDDSFREISQRQLPVVPTDNSVEGASGDSEHANRILTDLNAALEGVDGMEEMMAAVGEVSAELPFEATMFSNIKKHQNRVTVYNSGRIFNDLEQGKDYPFAGTIAEMILDLGVDYLIVDDTMESLKPIDWALFVPHGVRSYVALPFFARTKLHGVLIFCSTEVACYSEEHLPAFKQIQEAFRPHLARWRRLQGA